MAVQYLLPLRFLHSNRNSLLFGVSSRNPQRSSTFTSKSSPSLSLSSDREESRWVREEQRWIREEQRWIREEKRWNSERVSLLRQIDFLTTQLERPRQHRDSTKDDYDERKSKHSPLEMEDVKQMVVAARVKEEEVKEPRSLKMGSEGDDLIDVSEQQDDYDWKSKHPLLEVEEDAKEVEVEAKERRSLRVGSEGDDVRELQMLDSDHFGGSCLHILAGTGGAGPTILSTSFLLLGEDVIAYNKGEEVSLKPYSGMINVDFGRGIRKRDVFLLNLPEVRSAHEILGVPTVSARFGTAPFFWNWGMSAIANFVPVDFLRNRNKVQKLVQILDPFVRAVDGIAGERVSMRIDLECSNGQKTVGIFSHKKLSVSVGNCTAAFVLAVLEGSSQPGVWFPEEPEGLPFEVREILLKRASQGTINFAMNKAPWMVETNPKEIGLGIYV